MSRLAPVALFAYKRPDHLARTVSSLLANPEAAQTDLFVFCDEARHPSERVAVGAVRAMVSAMRGFQSITVCLRDENLGLAGSIISGVTEVLRQRDRVVVIEDDLVLSPRFLRFMNDGLDCYSDEPRVASIHGYCYPVRGTLPETFFMRGADCWGWATWRRAWTGFRHDGAALLRELSVQNLLREFDLDGAAGFARMLRDQVAGRNDSWAIRWHASCFLAGQLTLYPGTSLVENVGNDASGTHGVTSTYFAGPTRGDRVEVRRIPLEASEAAREEFIRFFRSRRRSLGETFRWAVRRVFGSVVS